MKILHSADWHLDAPMSGHSEEETLRLRKELRKIPEKIAKLCKAEGCELMLLAGDLFDGPYTRESLTAVRTALESVQIPVIITPGNHDFCGEDSAYLKEEWPGNVHIFTKPEMERYDLPELDCTVYGAGYSSMECPGLMKRFHADSTARWKIGVLHGEAGVIHSTYCPVTKPQIQDSGLNYLAMGHIHKGGSLTAGDTLCAWPGCPMGRGFDELGAKGVLMVDLGDEVKAHFIPLDTPRFYDEEVEAGDDPAAAVASLLPGIDSSDFYRITLTGYSAGVNLSEIAARFPHIPNLTLRDNTRPEMDLWSELGADTLEGVFFGLLHEKAQSESPTLSKRATLAARIARQILDGEEVKLP
ncbi:MAG: metallophosphoesterase [Oscillospiraceae bacterium]|nr:metallophosphoesterase [Oscillospiraceae bacterium]